MPQNSSGSSIVIAAVILGASILGGGYLIKMGVDGGTARLDDVKRALAAAPAAGPGAPAPTAAAQPPRQQRPDPERIYQVAVGKSPIKGSKNAPVTVVEFSDFQCPYCRRVGPTLAQIEKEYGDKVQIAFKHLPLSMHTKAKAAHIASEAAHRQGRFWEMHDKIFADQRGMSEAKYLEYAKELGLDMKKFEADLASESVAQAVENDLKMASSLGVTGTPGFFVNGRFLRGAQPFDAFKRLIDQELAKKG